MAMMDIQIDNDLASVIDQTAMILVSMKSDPTPPSSPAPTVSPSHQALRASSPSITTQKNESCECMLCTRNAPIILSKCHTWAWIMRVVFYSLRDRYPEKKFFSLKNDVYEYMMNHWNILGLDRKPSANWHKQIQDMLSHSRNIFESGMTHFKQNGFWRLKDLEDPWTARPDTPRPPSTTPPLASSPIPNSPRKRGWKTNEEELEDDVQATLKKLCTPPASPRLSLASPRYRERADSLTSRDRSDSFSSRDRAVSFSSTRDRADSFSTRDRADSFSSSRDRADSFSSRDRADSFSSYRDRADSLSSSCSSACSSRPSSPEPIMSPPQYNNPLKASEELEKEVANLREQLNYMTESIAQLTTDTPTPSPSPSPTPFHPQQQPFTPAAFSHNRVWEETYSFPQQHSITTAQA